MPTEREALYAAVLAEPEADAPRLVYADWLEEHPRGEADTARAQFIRLEIEAENLPDDAPEREALDSAAATLYNRFGESWDHELPTWDEWYDSIGKENGLKLADGMRQCARLGVPFKIR